MENQNVSRDKIMWEICTAGRTELDGGKYPEALAGFKIAFKKAKKLRDDQQTRKRCMLNLGAVHLILRKSVEGMDVLQNLKKEGYDEQLAGALYFNLGIGYELADNPVKALRYFEKALSTYDQRDCIDVLSRLGRLYYSQQEYVKAYEIYEKAMNIYEGNENTEQQVICMYRSAMCLERQKKSSEAAQVAGKCTELCQKIQPAKNSTVLCKLYNELGLLFTQCNQFQQAKTCFDLALPLTKRDKKSEAIIHQNLGAIYSCFGQFNEAIECFEKAVSLHAKAKTRNAQGQCFSNLGFAYSKKGNYELSEEKYKHALQAAKDTEDSRSTWQTYEGLGVVAFKQKNLEKAEEYFNEALSTLSTTENENRSVQARIAGKLKHVMQEKLAAKKRTDTEEKTDKENCDETKPKTKVDENAIENDQDDLIKNYEKEVAKKDKEDEDSEDECVGDDDGDTSDNQSSIPKQRAPSQPQTPLPQTSGGHDTYLKENKEPSDSKKKKVPTATLR